MDEENQQLKKEFEEWQKDVSSYAQRMLKQEMLDRDLDPHTAFEIVDGWNKHIKRHCIELELLKTQENQYIISNIQMDLKDMGFVIEHLIKEKTAKKRINRKRRR